MLGESTIQDSHHHLKGLLNFTAPHESLEMLEPGNSS